LILKIDIENILITENFVITLKELILKKC